MQQSTVEDLQTQQGETLVSTSTGAVDARAVKGVDFAQTFSMFDNSYDDDVVAFLCIAT
jgi:hypothetical protein